MNILYCGDEGILDGLIISLLSLVKNTSKALNVYILTMCYQDNEKKYQPLKQQNINELERILKNKNKDSFIKLIDITEIANASLPLANLDTRFTPYCMLRLYADIVPELPNKILYLDTDVVALKDPSDLYDIDNTNYELVGVLDYYGSLFFKRKIYRKDYLNSGVLLLNLELIRNTKLFSKARRRCLQKKMFLPDQTAINILSKKKLIVPRKYNEQKKLYDDTVFRHFTTTFKFWPKVSTQTIKPWHIDKVHDTLNMYEIDDILNEYQIVLRRIKKNEK